MPNSYAQRMQLTCPQCHKTRQAEVWLILDVEERPDLLARAAQGTLHDLSCPHCEFHEQTDAPLLIFRSRWDILAFSPARGTGQEADPKQAGGLLERLRRRLGAHRQAPDQQQAAGLLERLRRQLGAQWQAAWPEQMVTVPRQVLGVYLLEGHEAMERELAKGNRERAVEAAGPPPDEPAAPEQSRPSLEALDAILWELLETKKGEDIQRLLQERPELLDARLDDILLDYIERARAAKYEKDAGLFESYRVLLRDCRERGVEAVLREINDDRRADEQVPAEVRPLLERLDRLTRLQDMPERVQVCLQALRLVNQDRQPEVWAKLQAELGDSLLQNPQGNRAENLEQAITCYQRALTVYTREAFPSQWGATQNNLASAYAQRMGGDLAENQEKAIQAFQNTLIIYTRETSPESWAMTQSNLANVYMIRIRGELAENLEQVITCYQQALTVYTREAFPLEWLAAQNNLARAYAQRIRGEPAENLEQAIASYQQALAVRTRGVSPADRAMTQNGLGNVYAQRIRGEPAENLEQAIGCYQQAMLVFTRQASPEQWAMTQNNLANAYMKRIRGERAENVEEAIQTFQQALTVYTRASFPTDWAMTQHNLAHAYTERIRGEQAENLEQAIACYRQALTVRTREALPKQWAATQNSMANAYIMRIRGERAENLEQAIDCFQQSLTVRTRESFPIDWAMTQNNLVRAYAERIHGERAENLEQAIQAAQQALTVYTRESLPIDWAASQNNLANTYMTRMRGERAENVEQAIACYEQALTVRTREAFPVEWAETLNGLGNAYTNRIDGERMENLEKAIQACQHALTVHTLDSFPAKCALTAQNLGNACFEAGRWPLCAEAYTTTLAARRVLLERSLLREGQEYQLEQNRNVPARAAYAFTMDGQMEKAVEVMENGRAQLLAQALAKNRQDFRHLAELGEREQAIYRSYQTAVEAYDRLSSLGENRLENWQAQMETAQQAVDQAVADVRTVKGYEDFLLPVSFEQIARVAAAIPLVYLMTTTIGGLGLVLHGSDVEEIWLPDIAGDPLWEKLFGRTKDSPSTDLGGYLGAYTRLREMSRDRAASRAWMAALDGTTQWLWTAVMSKIIACLQAQHVSEAVLIPAGMLGLLPLHAAWMPNDQGGRRYALDEILFRYSPSAVALQAAQSLAAIPADSILAIENPDRSLRFASEEVSAAVETFARVTRLAGQDATVERVKAGLSEHTVLHFSTHGMAGFGEPLESMLLLADGQHLTLGELLDMRLTGARLAVLSACETGIPGIDIPDEVISLPSGFLQAGAGGVIGSLWVVNDPSTMMLMARFYEAWRKERRSPAEALRAAQQWLRDTSAEEKKRYFKPYSSYPEEGAFDQPIAGTRMPAEAADAALVELMARNDYSHPYYWAAFQYIGA